MTQISEIYSTQSNSSQQKHPNKISFLGFWAINKGERTDSKKAINANVIQYDNINLERKKKGLIIDNNKALIIIVVAVLTKEIIIINNMLALNIRKTPGLVYPVTPLLQSTPSRPESRIVTPHQDSAPDGWFRGEIDLSLIHI